MADTLAQIAPGMAAAAEAPAADVAPGNAGGIWREGLERMPDWLVDVIPQSAVGVGFTWLNLGLFIAGVLSLGWLVLRFRTHRPQWSEGIRQISNRPVSMRDALMAGGFMALYVGLNLAVMMQEKPETPVEVTQLDMVVGVSISVLMFFAVLLFLPLTRKTGWKLAFGLRRETLARDIWVGVLFFFVGFLVTNISGNLVNAVLESMGHPVDKAPQEIARQLATMTNPVYLLILAVMTCLLMPLAEEVIFRGVLFPYTTQTLGLLAALVIVSLFFGVAHAVGSIIIPLGLLGGVFAAAYIYSGSLTSSITAHALFNLNSTLYLLFVGVPEFGV